MAAVRCPPARGRSVTAADHGAAVGGGTAGQGVVELEVDVVQEVAVGFCLVSSCRGIHISNGHEAEHRVRLSGGDGVEVILAQVDRCAAGATRTSSRALCIGAVMPPGICAAGCFSVRHDPDVPFLSIDGTGGQTEGIVASVILKGTFCGKFLTVNSKLLTQSSAVLDGGLALLNQPVQHLHELIPSCLAGLGGIHVLLGADDQSHGIHCGTTTVIQTPFVHAGRGGFDILIQGTFLIRVQLCGVGIVCGFQSNTGNVGVGIFLE